MSLKDKFEQAYKDNGRAVNDIDIANAENLQAVLDILQEDGLFSAQVKNVKPDAMYLAVSSATYGLQDEWVTLRYRLDKNEQGQNGCYFWVENEESGYNIDQEAGRTIIAERIAATLGARKAAMENGQALARVFRQALMKQPEAQPEEATTPAIAEALPQQNDPTLAGTGMAPWQEEMLTGLKRVVAGLNTEKGPVRYMLRAGSDASDFSVHIEDSRRPHMYGGAYIRLVRGPWYKGFAPTVKIRNGAGTNIVMRGPDDEKILRTEILKVLAKEMRAYDQEEARKQRIGMPGK